MKIMPQITKNIKIVIGIISLLVAILSLIITIGPQSEQPIVSHKIHSNETQNTIKAGHNITNAGIINQNGVINITNSHDDTCLEQQSGIAKQWLCDKHIAVKVIHNVRGALVSKTPYKIALMVKNLTSMPLTISKIELEEFDSNKEKNFSGYIHVPYSFSPNEKKEIVLNGNELLPYFLSVKLYHDFSLKPSSFKFDLLTKKTPKTDCIRQLKMSSINSGFDGIDAIIRAAIKLDDEKYRFFAAFPGNSNTYIEKPSRLEFIKVNDWVVNFCSPEGKLKTVFVSQDGIEIVNTSADCKYQKSPLPAIGNQEAIMKASQSNIICSSGKELRALAIPWKGEILSLWILPYFDSEDRRIIFNAVSGDNLTIELGGIR